MSNRELLSRAITKLASLLRSTEIAPVYWPLYHDFEYNFSSFIVFRINKVTFLVAELIVTTMIALRSFLFKIETAVSSNNPASSVTLLKVPAVFLCKDWVLSIP